MKTNNSFFKFIKQPHYSYENYNFAKKIQLFIVVLLFDIIISNLLGVIGFTFYESSFFDSKGEYFVPVDNNSITDPIQIFIFDVIIIPILEELIFRLPLKFTSFNISLTLITILFYYCNIISLSNNRFPPLNETFLFQLVFIFSIFILSYWLSERNKLLFKKLWERKFSWIFYFQVFLFGFLHLSKFFVIDWKVILFSILFVSPQICGGIFLGYTRVKIGIIASILMHGAYNLILFILEYFFNR